MHLILFQVTLPDIVKSSFLFLDSQSLQQPYKTGPTALYKGGTADWTGSESTSGKRRGPTVRPDPLEPQSHAPAAKPETQLRDRLTRINSIITFVVATAAFGLYLRFRGKR